jgi:hypothetical protein
MQQLDSALNTRDGRLQLDQFRTGHVGRELRIPESILKIPARHPGVFPR